MLSANEDSKSRIEDISSNGVYEEMTKPVKCVRLKDAVEEPPYETVGGKGNEGAFYQDKHTETAVIESW